MCRKTNNLTETLLFYVREYLNYFSYVTEMQGRLCDNLAYIDLAKYDQVRCQPPIFLQGWVFHQSQMPPGWNAQEYGPWEPVSILTIPNIPSRYHSGTVNDHTDIIAYVPNNIPQVHPTRGYRSANLQKIKMLLCGPRIMENVSQELD